MEAAYSPRFVLILGIGRLITFKYINLVQLLCKHVIPCQFDAKDFALLHNLSVHIFDPFYRLVMTAVLLFIDEDINLVETSTI